MTFTDARKEAIKLVLSAVIEASQQSGAGYTSILEEDAQNAARVGKDVSFFTQIYIKTIMFMYEVALSATSFTAYHALRLATYFATIVGTHQGARDIARSTTDHLPNVFEAGYSSHKNEVTEWSALVAIFDKLRKATVDPPINKISDMAVAFFTSAENTEDIDSAKFVEKVILEIQADTVDIDETRQTAYFAILDAVIKVLTYPIKIAGKTAVNAMKKE